MVRLQSFGGIHTSELSVGSGFSRTYLVITIRELGESDLPAAVGVVARGMRGPRVRIL